MKKITLCYLDVSLSVSNKYTNDTLYVFKEVGLIEKTPEGVWVVDEGVTYFHPWNKILWFKVMEK